MSRPRFKISLGLACASGAAALAHETLWTRRMVDVLGASAETFSKVVGAFFLGLALGAWVATRLPKRSWRWVGTAELAVGLLAIPLLFSPIWAQALFTHAVLVPWLKILLPMVLIVPPALAMGLFLPWLINTLAAQEKQNAGFAVWLYAANTFGGIVGITAVLLLPVPMLGLTRLGLILCSVNLLVAIAAWMVHAFSHETLLPATPTARLIELKNQAKGNVALAFISGFLVLGLEVTLQHQFAQVTINSQFSAGTILALVLLGLAIASVLLQPLVNKFGEGRVLRFSLLGAGLYIAVQPYLFVALRDGVTILPYELALGRYTLEILKLGFVVAVPVFIAAGMIFPLLLRKEVSQAGKFLAWNGLGGWLGAEFAQSILGPWAGLWLSAELIAASYLLVWWFLISKEPQRFKNLQIGFAVVVVLAGFGFAHALPQATILPGERLASLKVGREGVVATVECAADDWRILFNNSYTLGGSRAQFNQERQGLLPLLLHGSPNSVATLGVATGGTLAGTSLYPGIKRIDAIELSPLVLADAREFFSPFDRGVFQDPRVHFIVDDARWVMARNADQYDVIIGDLFLPWRTGEGRLFTLEHFQNVKRALTTNGIYCQWLPLFQLTRAQFNSIARTFRQTFPDAFLVRGDFYFELPIVGLVGGRELSSIDWRKIEQACTRLRENNQVSDPLVRHPEGIAMLVLGPLPDPGPGPTNTLGNSWLEWDAGRNIIGMKTPWFLGVPCAEYVRGVQRSGVDQLPERYRVDQDLGEFFLTLEVAATIQLSIRTNLEAQIPLRMPKPLIEDAAADWRQWPSRVKFSFTPAQQK